MSKDKEASQKDMLFDVVNRVHGLSVGIRDTLLTHPAINYDDLGVVETMYDRLCDAVLELKDAELMLKQIEK